MEIYNSTVKNEDFPKHYEFENFFDREKNIKLLENYRHFSLYLVLIYFCTIYWLKNYMKTRPAFNLKPQLAVWNLILAIFSIGASLRLLPTQLHALGYGYATSVCNNSLFLNSQATIFWGSLYVSSKVLELGDTVFLILRKKKLIFLHWYHHAVTMTMVFYLADRATAIAHWFTIMNVIVHSFMYTYYFLMTLEFKLPRILAICLTSCQVLQMIIGMVVCFSSFLLYMIGVKCDFPVFMANVCLFLYAVYFYLFTRLFYDLYISKPKAAKKIQ
ncbi:elongation of very long chain fatty acids protein 6-like [Centruroides sculpturatus]|uniref:elongation of very long chain fatty acids protein 6-like n=1 Tax=Centruroides sculpturatus TaxID=218467 RepID=UPI000C6D03EC|nr:elongation of very long chain fatty acids protein 6-like [Centruroides sculpturatus]